MSLAEVFTVFETYKRARANAERAFDAWLCSKPRTRSRRMARGRLQFWRRERNELDATIDRMLKRYLVELGRAGEWSDEEKALVQRVWGWDVDRKPDAVFP